MDFEFSVSYSMELREARKDIEVNIQNLKIHYVLNNCQYSDNKLVKRKFQCYGSTTFEVQISFVRKQKRYDKN